ncbi:GlxA family transcriptional regulator [Pseudorhodoferax sp.]|uniref:GlxA family transcriptional regulator n=1 Tax=Pseudorhodoferax sp. TaxID=1993553 RepID=UPI002DD66445|nr:helix-turn-helix domain-containing protein [Pseudorhodoferax sp.]
MRTLPAPAAVPRCRVAVVAFDGISPFHLSVPCVVFGEALAPHSPFELQVCAAEPAPLRTRAGFALTGLRPLRTLQQADVVVVPSWRNVDEHPPEALLRALRAAHARGAFVVGLCLGSHVLAEAGLLDGLRATTHWEYAARFARRYPAVQVEPDVLYVEQGRILTSAGTAAGLDACLHLLRQRLGAERASQAARRLVIAPHRAGGQAQFIPQPLPARHGGSPLTQLMDSVRSRLQHTHSLDSLAAEARMSRRSLTRQFKAHTGTSVQAWLLAERVQLAQRLLEQTRQPMTQVAEAAGFGSPEAFRLHFRRVVGVPPMQWRRSFQG